MDTLMSLIKDLQTGTTTRLSTKSAEGQALGGASQFSNISHISRYGQYMLFESVYTFSF